jgi:hypothetical protein
MLYYSIAVLPNEKGTIGKLAHIFYVRIPLALVFYKFNILRKRCDSDKAGYEKKYVAFAVQAFLKLTIIPEKCCAMLC